MGVHRIETKFVKKTSNSIINEGTQEKKLLL